MERTKAKVKLRHTNFALVLILDHFMTALWRRSLGGNISFMANLTRHKWVRPF
jgi:hypothetical protein